MKSKWITYKGRKVWFADYSKFGTDAAALRAEVDESDSVVFTQAEYSMYTLIDVRDTVATGEAIEVLKVSAQRTRSYTKRSAVVGVAGVRKMMLDMVNFFSRQKIEGFGADEMDKALDWLVGE